MKVVIVTMAFAQYGEGREGKEQRRMIGWINAEQANGAPLIFPITFSFSSCARPLERTTTIG